MGTLIDLRHEGSTPSRHNLLLGGLKFIVLGTLTSILSLGEGEEEKIRMGLHASTFSMPTQGFFSLFEVE
jgi:hypothetical protein